MLARLRQLRVMLGVEAVLGSRFGLPARAVGWQCRGLETMNKRLKTLEATSAGEHMLTEVLLVAVKKAKTENVRFGTVGLPLARRMLPYRM